MKREFWNTGGTRIYGNGNYSVTDEHGNHYNQYGAYVGRTDENGLMWDEYNNYVGRIDENGRIWDEYGAYLGYVDEHGNAFNAYGGVVSEDEKAESFVPEGCFLTTACVEYNGLEDDCYELTTLRRFRDTYMVDDMKSDVLKYYNIAPKIVDIIDSLPEEDKKIHYDNIYSIVRECCRLIESGDNEATYSLYKKMVEDLSNKFLTEDLIAI